MTDEEFIKFKTEFENRYKQIGTVRCPYLNDDVAFNAMGLEHLKFMRKNHARVIGDQLIRMRLFPSAPEILKLSHTVQGVTHTRHLEPIRTNQRNEIKMLSVSYYEFVAILHDKRVRVVVKKIDNGPKFFWSIIPFWKYDMVNKRRKMAYGNPEVD